MISRYWHTLRYLRPVQFYGRLWFRLYRPTPDLRPAPAVRPVPGRWVPPVAKPVSLLGPATFCFLNETHTLAGAGHEAAGGRDPWNDPARDKLWLYNLHYFDDLNAAGREERQPWHLALLQRWVNENPPGYGNGWEPYPTSLRIVNWIKWSLTFAAERGGVAVALPPACLQSLAVQARWLSRRLEHHLLGNHLFANAKALVYAGAFFVGPEADRWRTLGLRLLARELDEQILPDGGHFERSPMYHAILLEDVLDLINLAGAYPGLFDMTGTGARDRTVARARADAKARTDAVAHWRATANAMLRWLAAMTYPDGEISFFNDAAMGIAPPLVELVAYAARLGIAAEVAPASPCCWLRDSGYVRLAAGPAVALLDVAPIGPDYLPGHAHADTLSFELSLFGQRVIVNGGTSRYGSGPERLAERGTAAHSTVQIDGADSSEVWGGFRVARRARPLDVAVSVPDSSVRATAEPQAARPDRGDQAAHGASSRRQGCRVSAAHDGYRRLPGRPVHRRSWCLTGEGLVVSDVLEGDYVEAVARFHLHPAVRIERDQIAPGDAPDTLPNPVATPLADTNPAQRATGTWLLPDGQAVAWRVTGGQARIVANHWHPQFGLSAPSLCLEVSITGRACRFELSWAARA